MLCNTCRSIIALTIRRTQYRALTSVPASTNAAPINPPPSPQSITSSNQTPATSSSTPGISQPLSNDSAPPIPPSKLLEKNVTLQSSIPGGAELKGLAYLKAKPHVLAKEDDQYPEWLWTLLEANKQGDGKSAVDLAAMTKKQRIKYDRKQAKLMKDVAKPIPIHEQSSDLTRLGDSAGTSLQRRQEITKSSRDARRKSIRESNFLRGM